MDFQPTEEQRMIVEMAREVVAREIEPAAAAHPPDQPLPKDVMPAIHGTLHKLGVVAPRLPEHSGCTVREINPPCLKFPVLFRGRSGRGVSHFVRPAAVLPPLAPPAVNPLRVWRNRRTCCRSSYPTGNCRQPLCGFGLPCREEEGGVPSGRSICSSI